MKPERANKILALVFALVLGVFVCLSPARAIWDEQYYLANCTEFLAKGFSLQYLREFHISTGPLFALIYALPVWLTDADTRAVRIFNLGLWIVVAWLTRAIIRQQGKRAEPIGSPLLYAPMAWTSFGLAMTESVSLCPFLASARIATSGTVSRFYSFCAGLLLGVSACGRQLLLAALPGLCLVIWLRGRRLECVALAVVGALILPAGLFAAWGGLISPEMYHVGGTRIDLSHALLALAFVGIAMLCLDYRLLMLKKNWVVLAAEVGLSMLIGVVFRPSFVPMPWLIGTSPGAIFVFNLFCCWLAFHTLVCLGFVAAARTEPLAAFAGSAIVLLALAASSVASQFSSRYVVICLPLIAMINASKRWPITFPVLGGRLAGALLGVAILLHYYVKG
jgi:hypothetical protein